ncbi:zinc-ribbon domain-containing protein, partial [Streptomyces sp. NPDC003860]
MARPRGVSLAEAYPQVAAMWLQERNGGLTPANASPKMQVAMWWRCTAGHECGESISTRTTLPKWKDGDVAACRECVGYKVSYTHPDCGHTLLVKPEAQPVLGLPADVVAGQREA